MKVNVRANPVQRPSMEYRMSRLWDLQAVFLSEAFSLYCSRRPSRHFSQRFEDLLAGVSPTQSPYVGLWADPRTAHH